MKQTYVIISDNRDDIAETKAVVAAFPAYSFVGSALDYDNALNLILEQKPALVFLEIEPINDSTKLSLSLINELYRFLDTVPQIIVTAKGAEKAYEALRYDVLDYLIAPFRTFELRKSLLRFEKSKPFIAPVPPNVSEACETIVEVPDSILAPIVSDSILEAVNISNHITPEKPLIICVKSYGDYRFIEAKDICYLQADNNSTDIHLHNGEMITGFKTLKHFEAVLSAPFIRIHNSYIVNMDYVSRIHTGNSVCYIKNTSIKLPFSKSYKENVDAILSSIANGNYIEI